MEKLRIMLVDDHDVVRQGLKSLLEGYPNIEVVAEASNGKEAINQGINFRPDVTLMDVSMPEMDGIEATKLLKQQCPNCEVLALTVHEDKQFLFEMLVAGASGYVSKRSLADDVVAAIEAVAKGDAFLSPSFTRMLIDNFCRLLDGDSLELEQFENIDSESGLLSDREKQVVKLVAEGHRSADVGELLGITTRTVSRHRARITEKLDIHTTAELVRYAIRTGLVKA